MKLSRLRATAALWWSMMRMQRITREGWFYIGFTLVVGAAAINTGNNLLYLVLGLQVSLLLLSAFLSETVLSRLHVTRIPPSHAIAGRAMRVQITVRNKKGRMASHSLLLWEEGLKGAAVYFPRVAAGELVSSHWTQTLPRRGVLELGGLYVSTRFPFGLFEKTRRLNLPSTIPIHPAGEQSAAAEKIAPAYEGELPEPRPGAGPEFHALRGHREGDDVRQIHWRSAAKTGKLVVVEREQERRSRLTLLVDTRGAKAAEDLDGAADVLVALSRRLLEAGCEVGVRLPDGEVVPGVGRAQLRRIADCAALLAPPGEGARAPAPFPGTEGIPIPLAAQPAPKPPLPAPPPPALSPSKGRLDLHRIQRWSLLAATLIAFAALWISGEMPAWVLILFGASFAAGLLLNERPSGGLRSVVNLGTIALLLLLAAGVFLGSLDIMLAAPSFAAILAASRLLSRRGPKDDPLLLLSALMMLAGGAALTGDIAYGLLFCTFAVVLTVALSATHLRREMEQVLGSDAPKVRGSVSGGLLTFLGGISLTVLVGSLFVFLAFPRISVGVMSRMDVGRVGGGSDRIELGGVGVLKDNPIPVMRVNFATGEPPGEMYWRTSIFDAWDGRGWIRVRSEREEVQGGGGLFVFETKDSGGSYDMELELLRNVRALPLPADLLSLRFPFRRGVPHPRLIATAGQTFEVEDAPSPLRLQVRASRGRASASDPGSEIATWLEVPVGLDPRIRNLAQSFDERGGPEELARSMEAWLQRENGYTRELPGFHEDPLSHFLFERREGHCEFFATSLTLLLRLRGIPARVVTGYYGVSWVESGSYWVVREGDAHAWTEAWIQGKGWIRLDATPADDRPGVAEGTWASLVEWADVWRMRWSQWVLDYDAASQARIARGIAGGLGGSAGGRGRFPLEEALRVAGGLLLLVVGAWAARRVWKGRGAGGRAVSGDRRRAVRLYRQVKTSLRRRGIDLGEAATAAEWREEAAKALPAADAAAVSEALQRYEDTRFGGKPFRAHGKPSPRARAQ